MRTAGRFLLLALIAGLFFSAPAASWGADAAAGTIEIRVLFKGEIPRSPLPDDAGVRRKLLSVDAQSGGLEGVVAWIDPVPENSAEAAEPKPAVMDQRDHEFTPRVIAVRAGQPVKFTNSDPANHNVRTSAANPTNEFNVYTGFDGGYTHRFTANNRNTPVRVGCDIHPWMRGWIYAFDHPFFAVSGRDGRLRLEKIPPGHYKVLLRQPDLGWRGELPVAVAAGKTVELQVSVSPAR